LISNAVGTFIIFHVHIHGNRPYHGPGVDPAPSENEYQEYFLEVKAADAVRPTTSPPSCAECHEIWEPKPPGTLWATPGLLRDSCTFTFTHMEICLVWDLLLDVWTQRDCIQRTVHCGVQ